MKHWPQCRHTLLIKPRGETNLLVKGETKVRGRRTTTEKGEKEMAMPTKLLNLLNLPRLPHPPQASGYGMTTLKLLPHLPQLLTQLGLPGIPPSLHRDGRLRPKTTTEPLAQRPRPIPGLPALRVREVTTTQGMPQLRAMPHLGTGHQLQQHFPTRKTANSFGPGPLRGNGGQAAGPNW